jgi:hypothetical protein
VSDRQPSDFGDCDFYEGKPEGMDLFSWSPSPEGDPHPKPATQVHMHQIFCEGAVRLITRFKGPGTLDRWIDALIKHREDVWGKRGGR